MTQIAACNECHSTRRLQRQMLGVPYVAGLSEQLGRVYEAHSIQMYDKPANALHPNVIPSLGEPMCGYIYYFMCDDNTSHTYILGLENHQSIFVQLMRRRLLIKLTARSTDKNKDPNSWRHHEPTEIVRQLKSFCHSEEVALPSLTSMSLCIGRQNRVSGQDQPEKIHASQLSPSS